MIRRMTRRLFALVLFCGLAATILLAQKPATPHTILHVVTVKWKADSTPKQRQDVIDGVTVMAAKVPGVKSVWVKTIKVQPSDYSAAFAMEFVDQAAFDAYVAHPAHMEWKKLYDPIHEVSTTHDLTN